MTEPLMTEPENPERGTPPRRRSLRQDLTVGAALLVGVLLVGKVVSNGNGKVDAKPSPTVARPSVISVGPSTPVTTPPPPLPTPGKNVRACPATLNCYRQNAGNSLALAPVQELFGAARVVRFDSVRILTSPWSGSLWYRHLQFRINGQLLDIEVTVDDTIRPELDGTDAGRIHVDLPSHPYRVAASFPDRAGMSLEQLRRIADDERLLVT